MFWFAMLVSNERRRFVAGARGALLVFFRMHTPCAAECIHWACNGITRRRLQEISNFTFHPQGLFVRAERCWNLFELVTYNIEVKVGDLRQARWDCSGQRIVSKMKNNFIIWISNVVRIESTQEGAWNRTSESITLKTVTSMKRWLLDIIRKLINIRQDVLTRVSPTPSLWKTPR